MTQEFTHQKPSANRGAIAPNLPKRRHERLTTINTKPLAQSKYRRRRRGAPLPRHLLTVFAVLQVFFLFSAAHRCNHFFSRSEIICIQLSTYGFQLAPPIMDPDRMNVDYLEFVWRKDRNPELCFRHPR
jgi:hypothetical protein